MAGEQVDRPLPSARADRCHGFEDRGEHQLAKLSGGLLAQRLRRSRRSFYGGDGGPRRGPSPKTGVAAGERDGPRFGGEATTGRIAGRSSGRSRAASLSIGPCAQPGLGARTRS